MMTPKITPWCGIVLPHTSTSRSIKFRRTVLNVRATSCHCTAGGQGIPSHPWISFSFLTTSHQFKHWECTLPSLTSWISVTALTYFKLECGLSSPASSQNREKAILPEVDLSHDPCVTASFVYKFPRVCLCGGTRNKTRDLTELHIPPQNVCANPRKGTCTGWQHLRVAPA